MSGTRINPLLAASLAQLSGTWTQRPDGQWVFMPISDGQDAPWVQNLKRLVNPYADPRMEQPPRYPNIDPGLNRTGPRIGEAIDI